MKMVFTEKELEDLGFKRTDVPIEQSGCIQPYWYYTLGEYPITLISGAFEKGVIEVNVEVLEGTSKAISRDFIKAFKKEFNC